LSQTDGASGSFHEWFVATFNTHFPRVFRYLDRLTGDPELAADLAQETFIRLYRRGEPPEVPEAWMISVAMNLFRNAVTSRTRRTRLLTLERGLRVHSDPPSSPEEAELAEEARQRVRNVLARLSDRERQLLLLRAEGYSYRHIALALDLNETSVGTLLARARDAFRATWESSANAT
jgi:RNA polymerase sigma-70 factor (ECF subfamily)